MARPVSLPGREPDAARVALLGAATRRGVSLAALSEMIGRNPSYLQQYIRKGSPRKLEEHDRRVLAQFLGISEQTLGGDGAVSASSDDYVVVPRLPIDASAGPGAVSAEEISFDAYRFSARWMREMGLQPGQVAAIRVEGDSMVPLLQSGDEILVDQTRRAGEGVFVVRIGDALHVKQVQARGSGRIALISANEAYPPVELGLDEIAIIGRVVWKGGRI